MDPEPVTDAIDAEPGAFPGKLAFELGGDCDKCESLSGRDETPLNPCLTRCARCLCSGVWEGDCPSLWLSAGLITGLRRPPGGESGGGVRTGLDSCSGPFWVGRLVATLVSDWFTDRSYNEGLEPPGDPTDEGSGAVPNPAFPTARRRISS
jgi:hypothetical protein